METKETNSKPKDIWYNYRLKSAREEAGLSQGELGRVFKSGKLRIHFYERLIRFPSRETAERIAAVLNLDADYLFPKRVREIGRAVRKERKQKQNLDNEAENDGEVLCEDKQPNIKYVGYSTKPEEIARNRMPLTQDCGRNLIQKIQRLYDAIDKLDYRTRKVIIMYYGLDRQKFYFRQIGNVLGITGAGAHHMKKHGIKRLRELLTEETKD